MSMQKPSEMPYDDTRLFGKQMKPHRFPSLYICLRKLLLEPLISSSSGNKEAIRSNEASDLQGSEAGVGCQV